MSIFGSVAAPAASFAVVTAPSAIALVPGVSVPAETSIVPPASTVIFPPLATTSSSPPCFVIDLSLIGVVGHLLILRSG